MSDGFLQEIFFGDPAFPVRILFIGVSAYVVLVVIFRLSGKRTLASMNTFDFIVNVAVGSREVSCPPDRPSSRSGCRRR